MVFSSLLFPFRFLPAVLLVYYTAPGPLRNLVLILSSAASLSLLAFFKYADFVIGTVNRLAYGSGNISISLRAATESGTADPPLRSLLE